MTKYDRLTNEQLFELAEPFGYFEFGDAQGAKRLAFARAIEEAVMAQLTETVREAAAVECRLFDGLAG